MKHLFTPKSLLGALSLLMASLSPFSATAAVSVDEYGWTVITPSEDSRIYYVSSSMGDDANDGRSPETPKKTIAAANSLVRHNYPDHLLLKRGDTFTLPRNGLDRWKSGRSADEPLVFSYYGDSGPRPVVEIENKFVDHNGDVRNYLAFIGIDFYQTTADPNSDRFTNQESTTAFRLVGGGADILIEDCRFRYTSVVVESWTNAEPRVYTNFKLRRNIILDAWYHESSTTSRHTNGFYLSGTDGYLVEENFFDHNGWNTQIEDANANMYSHNVYIQYSNKAGGIIRGNISTRSAAHGAQMRSGGIAERNLFALAAIGANMGGVRAPTDPAVLDFDNTFRENVIISGRLMDPEDSSYPRTPAIWGFMVAFIGEVDAIDNIIANRRDGGGSVQGFGTVEEPSSLNLVDNIVYNWVSSQDMEDESWPHPDHDLGDYYASIGGEKDTIAYIEWLRERPIRQMPWEMTSYAAINYIREGFNKDPVDGYFKYRTLSDTTWGIWPKDDNGYVDTQDWLGWLYVEEDWAYSWDLSSWIFAQGETITEIGGWIYLLR